MATQFDLDIMAWQKAKDALATAAETEAALRRKVYAEGFPEPKEGVNNLDLGGGYTLKATRKINYNLKETKEGAETSAALDAIEHIGNEGEFIAQRIVTWKPSLSVSEYKKLDVTNPTHKKIKDIIDGVLTTSDGMPTLEVVYPKAK